MSFERMQELEEIRFNQEKGYIAQDKPFKKEKKSEFQFHREMEAKVEAYEKIHGKKFYDPNR